MGGAVDVLSCCVFYRIIGGLICPGFSRRVKMTQERGEGGIKQGSFSKEGEC